MPNILVQSLLSDLRSLRSLTYIFTRLVRTNSISHYYSLFPQKPYNHTKKSICPEYFIDLLPVSRRSCWYYFFSDLLVLSSTFPLFPLFAATDAITTTRNVFTRGHNKVAFSWIWMYIFGRVTWLFLFSSRESYSFLCLSFPFWVGNGKVSGAASSVSLMLCFVCRDLDQF